MLKNGNNAKITMVIRIIIYNQDDFLGFRGEVADLIHFDILTRKAFNSIVGLSID